MKIIVTGGSGFIGTNLISHYISKGFDVFNIDNQPPRNLAHRSLWKNIDIRDEDAVLEIFSKIRPEYVVHLAARTDLNMRASLDYYSANIRGVENIAKACILNRDLKRVVFSSSMLVNEVGYNFKSLFDYNPSTSYGQSKVIGEQIVFGVSKALANFCIIRPTSIWGEWFSEPYRNFFEFVLSGNFFHPGNRAGEKTYGYVGNAVYQIDKILFSDLPNINANVFYIGDYIPTRISDWANEIATLSGRSTPKKLPYFVFRVAAFLGDVLVNSGLRFPMTSFRLKNMTTDHVVELGATYTVCGNLPYDRVTATRRTLDWLDCHPVSPVVNPSADER
jgi:nucleoside-diphosphate-sugar epimerase